MITFPNKHRKTSDHQEKGPFTQVGRQSFVAFSELNVQVGIDCKKQNVDISVFVGKHDRKMETLPQQGQGNHNVKITLWKDNLIDGVNYTVCS